MTKSMVHKYKYKKLPSLFYVQILNSYLYLNAREYYFTQIYMNITLLQTHRL